MNCRNRIWLVSKRKAKKSNILKIKLLIEMEEEFKVLYKKISLG